MSHRQRRHHSPHKVLSTSPSSSREQQSTPTIPGHPPPSSFHRNNKNMLATPSRPSNPTASDVYPSRASKIFASMRRSLSYSGPKSSALSAPEQGMYSTAAERSPSPTPTSSYLPAATSASAASVFHTRLPSPAAFPPPSISQIAMGLHTSRTPHLGPTHPYARRLHGSSVAGHSDPGRDQYSHTHRPPSLTTQPTRSSMKKPHASATSLSPDSSLSPRSASRSASPSVSTTTSITSPPSTPRSASAHLALPSMYSGRKRIAKLFGLDNSQKTAPRSDSGSEEDIAVEPSRKAVRFSSSVNDETI